MKKNNFILVSFIVLIHSCVKEKITVVEFDKRESSISSNLISIDEKGVNIITQSRLSRFDFDGNFKSNIHSQFLNSRSHSHSDSIFNAIGEGKSLIFKMDNNGTYQLINASVPMFNPIFAASRKDIFIGLNRLPQERSFNGPQIHQMIFLKIQNKNLTELNFNSQNEINCFAVDFLNDSTLICLGQKLSTIDLNNLNSNPTSIDIRLNPKENLSFIRKSNGIILAGNGSEFFILKDNNGQLSLLSTLR